MNLEALAPWLPGVLAIVLGLIPATIAIVQHCLLESALRQALKGTQDAQRRALQQVPDLSRNVVALGLAGWSAVLLGILYLMAVGLLREVTP